MPAPRAGDLHWRRFLQRDFWLRDEQSLVVVALLIGALSGLAAAALVGMIDWIGLLIPSVDGEGHPPWWIVLIPAAGGLLIGPIVTKAAPETKGHGVPEVMLAVARNRGVIRARVAVLKAISAAITIGTGGSAGREGPIVQIGSAVGSASGTLLRRKPEMVRMLVACGAAGGIAASFNTPIAGVIFALEVILRDFTGRAFATVVIAAVTASVVSRGILGQAAFFDVPAHSVVSHWELLSYAALGVLGAVVARIFVVVLYRIEDAFEDLPFPGVLKPALGGLLLGGLAWFMPGVLGTGHGTIEQALHGELLVGGMLALAFAKILATSFTLGSGGSGGVFAPSLFMGAMLGGAFGAAMNLVFPQLQAHPGAYALVGMGVVFTGATWAAMSGILFLFELTRDYGLILPMMIACVTSLLVARRLAPDTIYTRKLLRRGIDLDARSPVQLTDVLVEAVMTPNPETIRADTPLRTLLSQVDASHHSGFPVVDERGRALGIITAAELIDGMAVGQDGPDLIIAQDVMRPFEPSVTPRETIAEAVEKMRVAGVRRLPVVEDGSEGRLLGILTNHDVVSTLARLRKESRP